MTANILIALSFFALGFVVGGVFTIASCWKILRKQAKELKNAYKDPLIIRIYEGKH